MYANVSRTKEVTDRREAIWESDERANLVPDVVRSAIFNCLNYIPLSIYLIEKYKYGLKCLHQKFPP